MSLLAVGAISISLLRLTAFVAFLQAQDLVCQYVMLESCIQVKAPRVAESAVHMECIVKHSYVTFLLALGMPYWCRGPVSLRFIMQFLELAAAHMLRLCRYDVKNDKVMHTRLINCRVLVSSLQALG